MTTYARGKKWAEAGKEVNERRNAQPEDRPFQLVAEFGMTGDQPGAVDRLADGVDKGLSRQSLMGVTGSGKTFTMANIVQQVQRPTLVMAHNKTLAAQLAQEFKEFFPHNAVEYFVSYYDYYQPEAYVPQSDTYIEKDSSVNEELDKLRLSATTSLLTRRDVLIVASVSCIYGLGDPQDYFNLVAQVKVGEIRNRSQLVRQLVDMQYDRNDLELSRAKFRVRGDVLELVPAYEEAAVRIQFFGDEVERIVQLDPLTGEMLAELPQVAIYPANHFVTTKEKLDRAVADIREELEWRLRELRDAGKILEAARLESRTNYDVEMLQETGFCAGVENYARHLSQRSEGSAPWTLLDYFPDDYLMFVDESHMTLPQVRGMYGGDISRKKTLVEFGFRLPSALDNRPLSFDEYEQHINQVVYVSATPGPYELQQSRQVVEQVIRPTGLLDPTVEVLPTRGQIDDLLARIKERVNSAERVLVTTLTKRMAEELADYLSEMGISQHLPALRHRDAGPHRDTAGPAAGRLRRHCRHQPAPGGAGPPRGEHGGHTGCRQGGLSPLRYLHDPDHRPRCAPCQRPRGHVRRQNHRFHEAGHRRDRPPPAVAERAQQSPRYRAAEHPERGALTSPKASRPSPKTAPATTWCARKCLAPICSK